MEYESQESRYKGGLEVLTGKQDIPNFETWHPKTRYVRIGDQVRCFLAHIHDAVEILLIDSDSTMHIVTQDEKLDAHLGDIVIFEPNMLHSGWADFFGKKLDYTVLVFESTLCGLNISGPIGSLLSALQSGRLHLKKLMPADHPAAPRASFLIRNIASLKCSPSRGISDEAKIVSMIYELIGLLLETMCTESDIADSCPDMDFVQTVADYVSQNYHLPISTHDICTLLNYNESHFCHKFRESFKCSSISYLNRYRINRAILNYRGKKLSIAAIAESVGFGDSCYFTRLFKQQVGVTPSQFFGSN